MSMRKKPRPSQNHKSHKLTDESIESKRAGRFVLNPADIVKINTFVNGFENEPDHIDYKQLPLKKIVLRGRLCQVSVEVAEIEEDDDDDLNFDF